LEKLLPLASNNSVDNKVSDVKQDFDNKCCEFSMKHDCAADKEEIFSSQQDLKQIIRQNQKNIETLKKQTKTHEEHIKRKANWDEIKRIDTLLEAMPTREEVAAIREELFENI